MCWPKYTPALITPPDRTTVLVDRPVPIKGYITMIGTKLRPTPGCTDSLTPGVDGDREGRRRHYTG